jgi:hypothetical protein
MTDTRLDIYIKQLEILLSKSDNDRFLVFEDLMLFGRKLMEGVIIQENKNLSDTDLKVEVFRRCYANHFTAEELDRITDSMKLYLQVSKKDRTM